MKITAVRTVLYEYTLNRPIADANSVGEGGVVHSFLKRADLAVFIDTDEGLTGVTVGSSAGESIIPGLAPLIVGEDPRRIRGLWHRMVDANFKWGNEGLVATAIAAIDNALWDLRAKINGVPLWRELGAMSPRVKIYASGLDMALTDDELRQYYLRLAAQGVTGGKLKVGQDPDADRRRLEIVQEALGGKANRPTLIVDANEFWSPKQAIRRMAELEREFDIFFCEEPVRRWDYRGLRQVSRAIRAAVATGENLKDIHEITLLLAHEAVDILQVNANMAGITACMRAADVALAFDRPVSMMNSAGRYSAHLAAALPHHTTMEVLDAGRDAVFSMDSKIVDGWLVLGDQPGNGITFDLAALERARAAAAARAVTLLNAFTAREGRAQHRYLAGVREGPTALVRDSEQRGR